MNKYLEKIAEQEGSATNKGAAVGLTGLSGVYANKAYHSGHVDGRTTLYHGTSWDRAYNILNNGLVPKGAKGATWAVSDEMDAKEEGLAFLTKNKKYAKTYSNIAEGIDTGKVGANDARGLYGYFYGKVPPERQGIVLKARVPLHKHDVQDNPALADNPAARKVETAIKGGVDSKYFTDSEHYKKVTGKEVLEHIKVNPGKFAAGVGIPAAGLATAYYKWNEK